MRRKRSRRWRALISFLSVALALALLALVIPVSETRWSQSLGIRGNIHTGEWASTRFGPIFKKLSLELTAEGFWEARTEFDWNLAVDLPTARIEIPAGERGSIVHVVSADRTPVSLTQHQGVRGEICVTNSGEEDTPVLALHGQVQFAVDSGNFEALPGASMPSIVLGQVAAAQRTCAPYEIELAPESGSAYRVLASLNLASPSGGVPEAIALERAADLSWPDEPTQAAFDGEARVSYEGQCPLGFTCTSIDPGPWALEGTGQLDLPMDLTNQDAPCESSAELVGKFSLQQMDSGEIQSVSLTQQLDSGPCPPKTASVRPILECVAGSDETGYTAFFGYESEYEELTTLPVGADNYFLPDPDDRGQPDTFQPGRSPAWPEYAFSVEFDGAELLWYLDGRTAAATSASDRCPESGELVPTPTPELEPIDP